jgi:hypothetical protein
MSHEVQLNPAASNSPAATLPSLAPAGHVTEAPDTVTPYKSGFSGHVSQASHCRPPTAWDQHFASGMGPGRDRRGGTDPHAHHVHKPAFLPAARGALAARRGPAYPPAPDARTPASGRRIALPAEPARQRSAGQARNPGRPVMYPGGTWHRPPADLRATARRQAPATTPAHPILPVMPMSEHSHLAYAGDPALPN